jgi:hypothetical protein
VAQFSRSPLKDLFGSHHDEFFSFPHTAPGLLADLAPDCAREFIRKSFGNREESTHYNYSDNARFQALNGQGRIPCAELAHNKSVREMRKK